MANQIVNFGSNKKKVTLVFDIEEDSEKLKIKREEEGFQLWRGYDNTASRVVKEEIFAFTMANYKQVHRYSLESGKWSLFYSRD